MNFILNQYQHLKIGFDFYWYTLPYNVQEKLFINAINSEVVGYYMNDEMDGSMIHDIIKGNNAQIGIRGLPNLYKKLNYNTEQFWRIPSLGNQQQ